MNAVVTVNIVSDTICIASCSRQRNIRCISTVLMDIQAVVNNGNCIGFPRYSCRPVALNPNTVAAGNVCYSFPIIFGMDIVLSIFRSNCNVGVIFYGNPIAFFIVSFIEKDLIIAS